MPNQAHSTLSPSLDLFGLATTQSSGSLPSLRLRPYAAHLEPANVATINKLSLYQGWRFGHKGTPIEYLAVFKAYGKEIATANAWSGHLADVSVSSYRAALVGAFHLHKDTESVARIKAFAGMVRTGLIVDGAERYGAAANTALRLHGALIDDSRCNIAPMTPPSVFMLSEYAMQAFLLGLEIKRLRVPDEQSARFSIPLPSFQTRNQQPLFE